MPRKQCAWSSKAAISTFLLVALFWNAMQLSHQETETEPSHEQSCVSLKKKREKYQK